MTNEQQQSPIFRLDKLKKHLYNTIWGIKQLLTYGCGGPHPWSVLKKETYVVKCPNAADPKIRENAKATIDRIKKSARRISNMKERRRTLPQPTLQTLMKIARSESVSKSFNQSPSHPAIPLASLLLSQVSLALAILSLLVLVVGVFKAADWFYLCTT